MTLVAQFAALFLPQLMSLGILCKRLLSLSQLFFGAPPFRIRALADGMRKKPYNDVCNLLWISPPTAYR